MGTPAAGAVASPVVPIGTPVVIAINKADRKGVEVELPLHLAFELATEGAAPGPPPKASVVEPADTRPVLATV